MILNGFRPLAIPPHKEKPACELYTTIEGHKIYRSTFDTNMYLVYNSDDKTYTAFERQTVKTDIDEDLTTLIRELF